MAPFPQHCKKWSVHEQKATWRSESAQGSFNHFDCVINFLALIAFIILCDQPHYPCLNLLISPNRNLFLS